MWISHTKDLGPKDFKIRSISEKHENCPQERTNMISSTFFAKAFEDLIRLWPDIKQEILAVSDVDFFQ